MGDVQAQKHGRLSIIPRDATACDVDHAGMMALASRLHEENLQRQRRQRRLVTTCHRLARKCYEESGAFFFGHSRYERALHRGIISHRSRLLAWWDTFLIFGVVYSSAYAPLAIVFPQARWDHHRTCDVILDILFVLDMLIRFRTSYAPCRSPAPLAS